MEIGQKFNKLTFKEYIFYIDNYKKYTDFNTLGLYRSIIETEKLNEVEQIEVREYAHKFFKKSFEFLQIKDPSTYFEVLTIGQELTKADERQLWENIRTNQQKILIDKKIKHRNFGEYSKHNCGDPNCYMNGVMAKQGTWLAEGNIHFSSDKNRYAAKLKSEGRKANRKIEKRIIERTLEQE
jgi:hypothetical protein